MDKYEQLEKLATLNEKGVISDEEFSIHKSRILSSDVSVSNQEVVESVNSKRIEDRSSGTLWLPVPSLILGLVAFLSLFDDSGWDEDQIAGLTLFSGLAVALGVMALARQHLGKGMAISGVVLGSIGLLCAIGMFN
jgi:hypothetical protein